MAIDDLVLTVARITTYKNEQSLKFGSGFFYDNTGGLHYVTNRHMVINEKDDYHPDKISLRLHKDAKNVQSNDDFFIDLYDENGNSIWKEHPTHGKNADVVAIPLDREKIC